MFQGIEKQIDFVFSDRDDHLAFFSLEINKNLKKYSKNNEKKNSWNKIKLMAHKLVLREHNIVHYKSIDKRFCKNTL